MELFTERLSISQQMSHETKQCAPGEAESVGLLSLNFSMTWMQNWHFLIVCTLWRSLYHGFEWTSKWLGSWAFIEKAGFGRQNTLGIWIIFYQNIPMVQQLVLETTPTVNTVLKQQNLLSPGSTYKKPPSAYWNCGGWHFAWKCPFKTLLSWVQKAGT